MPHRIAIYDMDKTITRDPTWTRFLRHAVPRQAPLRALLWPAAALATLAYGARLIDRAALKQMTQRLMLGQALPADRADALAEGFADRLLATGVLDGARARIAEDRAAGYRLVMATASYAFYVGAIAARLGYDDVIATGSARAPDGAVLARIAGENCYGPAKLRMIEAWLAGQGIARGHAHVRFYSDHVSDAPALDWADEAFAVNAHAPLRALAAERGWTLLDWR
ncbi:HAD-IB family hydrolase [Sphingomonas sp.]|uniref:HAD family hydrolase n=1 Tax=Sphingomonas sp. TaxID=28214 RepID=UPI002C178B33|nr:HAD-IB family hydrolase [Sphingomonas sp.]HWK37009.1 HAD-IB family hydrolase [Sphingomonas sp.]